MLLRALKVCVMGLAIACAGPGLSEVAAGPRPKPRYSKKEYDYANPPNTRFRDKRLAKVYKILLRQYKHVYAHVASDGYIFPNEERELGFNIRLLHRLVTIDKRNHKVLKIYRKLRRKQARAKRKVRRRYRRRRRRKKVKVVALSADEKYLLKRAVYHKKRYEKMIRRFACRYIKRYPKRHKSHCKSS